MKGSASHFVQTASIETETEKLCLNLLIRSKILVTLPLFTTILPIMTIRIEFIGSM